MRPNTAQLSIQRPIATAPGASIRTQLALPADLPDTATTGRKAVLKVWCMPIDKVHKTFSWTCKNRGEGSEAVQFLVAQQKVMEECGLLDVTIKVRSCTEGTLLVL